MGKRSVHREIFLMHNGCGPWSCFRCGDDVDYADLHVHHVDGNHDNNAVENLVAVTSSCHRKLHNAMRVGIKRGPNKKRMVRSESHKEAVRRAKLGTTHTEETKEKIRQKALGRTPTEETRAKLALAGTNRRVSPETRERMREAARQRWASQRLENS